MPYGITQAKSLKLRGQEFFIGDTVKYRRFTGDVNGKWTYEIGDVWAVLEQTAMSGEKLHSISIMPSSSEHGLRGGMDEATAYYCQPEVIACAIWSPRKRV